MSPNVIRALEKEAVDRFRALVSTTPGRVHTLRIYDLQLVCDYIARLECEREGEGYVAE